MKLSVCNNQDLTGGILRSASFDPYLPDLDKQASVTTVCHPVWQLGSGGLERQMVQILNGLPSKAFRHIVVVRGWDETSERLSREFNDRVTLIRDAGPARDRTWSRRLARILREHRVDVLHVRGLSMLIDSVCATDLVGDVRLQFSFHGFESSVARIEGLRRKIYREAILRCDDRWAVSDAAARRICETLNLPEEAFGAIPNGVNTDRFVPAEDRSSVRRILELPRGRFVVLCVANLKPVKGHEFLLEAVRRLGDDARRMTLVMVGADECDGRHQQWAAEHLDHCDVRFVGAQDDVRSWYQAADIFVLPSLWEGMSNALLEAMACGLPAVATRVGGNADVIRDGVSGLLVAPASAASLSEGLRRLLHDPAERFELGETARRHVELRFSLESTVSAYAAHYGQSEHERGQAPHATPLIAASSSAV